MNRQVKEGYRAVGKGIEAVIWTSPSRLFFWILPGELVTKKEASGFKRYRLKAYQLRKDALRKGMLVDVGDYYLVTETLVFDSCASAVSFIMGNSRSGDVAKLKRKKLIGANLRQLSFSNCSFDI